MPTVVVHPATNNTDILQITSTSETTPNPATTCRVGTSTYTDLLTATTTRSTGVRFPNVAIPKTSTIVTATLGLFVSTSSSLAMRSTVSGIKQANTAVFAATINNLGSRPRTTAHVTWSATWIFNTYKNSPTIKTIIQEIITQATWASGHALAIRIHPNASCKAQYFGHNHGTNLEVLTVHFTTPPTVTSVTPVSGTTAGGTLVTITGQFFRFTVGLTTVTFGTTPAPATTIVPISATEIQCRTPAHAAGTVSVKVTTTTGSGTKASAYTFTTPTPTPTHHHRIRLGQSTIIPHPRRPLGK